MAKQQVAAVVLGATISCAATAASSGKPVEAVAVAVVGVTVTHLVTDNKESNDSK